MAEYPRLLPHLPGSHEREEYHRDHNGLPYPSRGQPPAAPRTAAWATKLIWLSHWDLRVKIEGEFLVGHNAPGLNRPSALPTAY
jgi:hypothetical protein